MASYDVASNICQALGGGGSAGPKPLGAPGAKAAAGSAHPLMRCALSPDGRWIVAGAADGRVLPKYFRKLPWVLLQVPLSNSARSTQAHVRNTVGCIMWFSGQTVERLQVPAQKFSQVTRPWRMAPRASSMWMWRARAWRCPRLTPPRARRSTTLRGPPPRTVSPSPAPRDPGRARPLVPFPVRPDCCRIFLAGLATRSLFSST